MWRRKLQRLHKRPLKGTAAPADRSRARAGHPGTPGPEGPHDRTGDAPWGGTAAADAITPARPKDGAKDHNLELYGFVQLDAIQDFKRVNPDWDATLRPSRIPTQEGQFGGDGQSIFSVRQSRLGAKATGMLAGRPYEAKFEFDLFGTGVDAGQTTFRVRHMYAQMGPVPGRPDQHLFMDGDIFPNVLDYWGPTGMVFVRNAADPLDLPQRQPLGSAAVALEHPSDDIDPGNIRLIDENIAANIQSNEELPDLTAAVRYGGDWGHVRLAGILRKIGYETRDTEDNEPVGHETGWGINATTAIKLGLATPRLGVVYGRGIATYMNDGGMDLAPGRFDDLPAAERHPRAAGGSGEAARRFRLCGLAMVEDVELRDRLQLHQGREYELPGCGGFPQGRICFGQPAVGAGRQRPGGRGTAVGQADRQ